MPLLLCHELLDEACLQVARHGELQDQLLVVEAGVLRVFPRRKDAAAKQETAIIGVGGVVGEMSVLFRAAGPRVSKSILMKWPRLTRSCVHPSLCISQQEKKFRPEFYSTVDTALRKALLSSPLCAAHRARAPFTYSGDFFSKIILRFCMFCQKN